MADFLEQELCPGGAYFLAAGYTQQKRGDGPADILASSLNQGGEVQVMQRRDTRECSCSTGEKKSLRAH